MIILDVLNVTYNVITPIFIILGLGVLLGRRFEMHSRTISRLLIYAFSPALVFDSLSNTDLQGGELGQIALMLTLNSLLVCLVGFGIARTLKLERRAESAFLLTVTLLNAGNYGIPLNEFAFGDAGKQRAVIAYVVSGVLVNTLGVYLISRGAASTRQAIMNVFKIPLMYAAVLGLIVNAANAFSDGPLLPLNVEKSVHLLKLATVPANMSPGSLLPPPIEKSVHLAGQAAVPLMLMLLGLQLGRTSVRGKLKPVLAATGTRLVIAPLIAFSLAALLGLEGVTRQVAITQCSMSTAVFAGVLAVEFDGDAEFTTATILVSTLASVVTLSIILTILGVGS